MKTLFASALALLALSAEAFGARQTFRMNDHNVFLNVPSDWQPAPGYLGIPVAIMGPVKKGQRRPVVSMVYLAAAPHIRFKDEGSSKEMPEFKKTREAWLQKMGGETREYSPYQFVKLGKETEGYRVGHRYMLNGTEYTENMYFVSCRKRIYQFQTLVPGGRRDTTESTKKLVESFECR